MIKMCPICGGVAAYNPYFHSHICSSPRCGWMEDPKWEEPKKRSVNVYKAIKPKEKPLEMISVP